jgi:hypothetical protein
MQTKDVLEACIQQSEKAEAAKTVGDQTADDIDWSAVLSKVQLTERQANALAEVHHHVHASRTGAFHSCVSTLTQAVLLGERARVSPCCTCRRGKQWHMKCNSCMRPGHDSCLGCRR